MDLHGLPGSPSTPSWVRLASTAYAQTSSIVVDADVSAWPVGATVAVASTAIDPNEAETAVIAGGEGGEGGLRREGERGRWRKGASSKAMGWNGLDKNCCQSDAIEGCGDQ